MIASSRRGLSAAVILLLLSLPAAPVAADDFGQRCAELPAAVAAKRDAIRDAAGRDNLAAMAALANPDDAFGFGDVEDIGQAWAGWKQQGTDMAAIARALLALDCSVYRTLDTGYYVGWRIVIETDGRWIAFVAGD